jgi:hypothetical protein
MKITVHVKTHFNEVTFDSLSPDNQCKVLALYEVAYALEQASLKPLSEREVFEIYDMPCDKCFDTCSSMLISISNLSR